jgi:streptomycin 6-kinase
MNIPESFARSIYEIYGDSGKAWLQNLPDLIRKCELRWSITVLPPYKLSYNYVAPAVQIDGTHLVFKAGMPNPELNSEMEALRLFNGQGSCRLLAGDAGSGILLLEQLQPGQMLSTLEDDAATTSIAAAVMRQLWRPVPANHNFPTVQHWANGLRKLRLYYKGGTGPFPRKVVEEAEDLFHTLLVSMDTPVLLHGDLHHENILSAQRQPWLAIDPKGVVGEPAYEAGALLRNPERVLKSTDLANITTRRIDQLSAELQLDRTRIRGWGLAQAVLSAWWTFEDHGHGWERAIHLAEVISQIS